MAVADSKTALAKRVAHAALARNEIGLSVVELALFDIELGKDGAKWRHGYVPVNAAAVALKAHRKPGSKGATKDAGTIKRDAAKTARANARDTERHVEDLPGGKRPPTPTARKRPQHIYLSTEQRRGLSDVALREHIEAHKAAAGRARSPEHKANHENEIRLAKREQARRKAAAARAAKGTKPPTDIERGEVARNRGPLGKLTVEQINAKIHDPKTASADKRALKGELARRVVEHKAAMKDYEHALKNVDKEMRKEGIDPEKPEDAGRVFTLLGRLAPRLRPQLERLRQSHVGRGVKEAVNVGEVLKLALHGTIVPLTTLALSSVLASGLGIHLGAG